MVLRGSLRVELGAARPRPLRPRPPRLRKPNASIAQVDGSGIGDEPTGPNADEACATTRSSDVALITSFNLTPPQAHESLGLAMQAAPSSASASKLPARPPKPRMSNL